MYFVIFATDKPGHEEVRAAERPRHSEYIRDPSLPVRVRVGGPTLAPETEAMNGSLLIVEAEDITAVGAFVADDPFCQAGLFETVVIRPFHWGLGEPN